MKQLFILVAVAALTLTFSSCSKDHTCTCVDKDGEVTSTETFESKITAELACDVSDGISQIDDGSCSLD